MPYYEFECTECGERFTVKETFDEHDRHENEKCPKCKSKKVEQLITSVGAKTSKKT